MPPIFVRLAGDELAEPGLMFLIATVPTPVPSLFHSSTPLLPSSAAKNKMPPTLMRLAGDELAAPGLMFDT